ncbi:hypothetical protein BCR35DRAFT_144962 [Leucosporidium creatinivorum]|uniref:Uncharacterized protein n=1 Tax=Leucosporidium creatinivorum TaxID=106004 RepID=A0A1Y2EQJ8_9BASI|nr:hypothetical protein BCR35DRAFT_144962 [Leucosporidium creatinivorum]
MIPPLPTEILHHIIKLSLPVVSFRTYRERYDLLLAYSLVDSTWRVLSQQELQQHLYFRQGMSPPSFKLPARHNRRMYLGGKRPAVGQPVPDAELSNYSHLLRSGIKHLTIIYSTMTVEDLMLCDGAPDIISLRRIPTELTSHLSQNSKHYTYTSRYSAASSLPFLSGLFPTLPSPFLPL